MDLLDYLKDLPPFGWLTGIIIAAGLLRYLFKGLRFAYGVMVGLAEIIGDWRGEPARPGRAAQPGILERLANVEDQLTANGGSSLKDQTNRIETKLNEHIAASTDVKH